MELTHIDRNGNARMVDVTGKEITCRVAVAKGAITMKAETMKLVLAGEVKKGDVLTVAKVAGIMAAKKCSELIPMCHPIAITGIDMEFKIDGNKIEVESTVKTTAQTGVEMEALTAVNIACLTIYDMCKAADKGMVIGDICLVSKSGGKSGDYSRPDGNIVSVNISEKKGEKKKPVNSGKLIEDFGLEGDAHAGGGERQLSLLAHESIDLMTAKGLTNLTPGIFAENITTRGIELYTLPLGTKLLIGNEIVLQVTKIGKECHSRCEIYKQAGDCIMPTQGIFARIIKGGEIKAGDDIRINR